MQSPLTASVGQAELVDPVGWIIANGAVDEKRQYWCGYGQPDSNSPWTSDPDLAVHYLRRQDAELNHADNEDAWCVIQHTPSTAIPTATDIDPKLLRDFWGSILGPTTEQLVGEDPQSHPTQPPATED